MRECHIAINVLAFSCGIWIYKVKHDFKIPWELPRWQNKQSQAFIPGHIKLQLSLSNYAPEKIVQFMSLGGRSPGYMAATVEPRCVVHVEFGHQL